MADNVFSLRDKMGNAGAPAPANDTQRTAPVTHTPCIFDPDPQEDMPRPDPVHLSRDAILTYAADQDETMFRGLGMAFYGQYNIPHFERLEGVRILRGTPIFAFLSAVRNDDLQGVMELMMLMPQQIRARLNQPSFFYFTGSSDVCFVTPAHLARSFTMAHYLRSRHGVRFDIPDSEGRLPQHYWARHARDEGIFLYGELQVKLDMGRSDDRGDPPIWEAMEADNPVAAKGLSRCEGAQINTPRAHDPARLTPLMAQTAKASERMVAGKPGGRCLRTAWSLARSPYIDWDRTDWEDQTVMDIACNDRVRRLLDRARANPWPDGTLGLRVNLA